jgi:transcription initiation factor IIE alpha subunit
MTKIEQIEQKIAKLEMELAATRSRTYVTCKHCKKKKQIQNTVLFLEQWYEKPYGCTGGDNWYPMKKVDFLCGHCGNITQFDKNSKVYEYKFYAQNVLKYDRQGEYRRLPPREEQLQKLLEEQK